MSSPRERSCAATRRNRMGPCSRCSHPSTAPPGRSVHLHGRRKGGSACGTSTDWGWGMHLHASRVRLERFPEAPPRALHRVAPPRRTQPRPRSRLIGASRLGNGGGGRSVPMCAAHRLLLPAGRLSPRREYAVCGAPRRAAAPSGSRTAGADIRPCVRCVSRAYVSTRSVLIDSRFHTCAIPRVNRLTRSTHRSTLCAVRDATATAHTRN